MLRRTFNENLITIRCGMTSLIPHCIYFRDNYVFRDIFYWQSTIFLLTFTGEHDYWLLNKNGRQYFLKYNILSFGTFIKNPYLTTLYNNINIKKTQKYSAIIVKSNLSPSKTFLLFARAILTDLSNEDYYTITTSRQNSLKKHQLSPGAN